MPPQPKGIGSDENIFTSFYYVFRSITRIIFKIFEFLGYIVFAISDYVMSFVCSLLAVAFIENTPFPMKFVMYGIIIIRLALLYYGFALLFEIVFKNHTKNIFTKSYTSQCQGSVDGENGWDSNPLCKNAVYVGENYISGNQTTIEYNYDKMYTANRVCIRQILYWLVFLNIVAIPVTLKTV